MIYGRNYTASTLIAKPAYLHGFIPFRFLKKCNNGSSTSFLPLTDNNVFFWSKTDNNTIRPVIP